jgi:hypothetical protein
LAEYGKEGWLYGCAIREVACLVVSVIKQGDKTRSGTNRTPSTSGVWGLKVSNMYFRVSWLNAPESRRIYSNALYM